MEEEKQDVNVDSSTTEEAVTEANDQPQGEVDSPDSTEDTPSGGGKPVLSEVDEMGVPYQNRYMEMKRKYEDTGAQLSELKTMVQNLQSNNKQKYTKAQLTAFIANPDTEPEHRTWAIQEIEKLEEEKYSNIVKKEIQSLSEKQNFEKVRSQSFNYILQRNPEIAIRDNNGTFLGWNIKSPLFQKMDMYMRNPEIANNPSGLRVALALAKEDLSPTQVATQQKLKAQVKNLQKGTLVEGSGKTHTQVVDNLNRAKDSLRRSGHMKDANNAVKEWLKKQGKFEE